jgi:hypothetical protein
MAFEYKRYLTAMEEASESIAQNSLNPDDEDEDTCHGDHIERTRAVHAVARIMSSMFWEDYLIRGLGEMLTLHSIDSHHSLVRKGPGRRSQFETYTASLRTLARGSAKSYIMKILFPSYALEDLQGCIDVALSRLHEILKRAESATAMLEEYLTWIEHGAKLAAGYTNALLPDAFIDEDGNEEKPERTEPHELYNDVRVKAYALLKLSSCDAFRMADSIEKIDTLMFAFNHAVGIAHKLYITISPKAFERIFNAMVSKKNRAPNYEGTKFENIHELNEYIRQRVKESVEEPRGFIYNVSELLEESRVNYIDKLATEILEVLAFLPGKQEQKKFVSQFESGKIWLNASLGE